MRIIDFHAHLDDWWLDRRLPTAADMVDALDRFGVEAACVFTVMGLYGDCPRHNDALATRSGARPDRLIPFATVDPKEGSAAVEELERRLADPRFRGVKFHPWLQAFAPSMVKETMIALLRVAARHGVPVLFHDGTPPYSTTYQVADVARWVPEAAVVLGHAGSADDTGPAARPHPGDPGPPRLPLRAEAGRPRAPSRDGRGRQGPLRLRLRRGRLGIAPRADRQRARFPAGGRRTRTGPPRQRRAPAPAQGATAVAPRGGPEVLNTVPDRRSPNGTILAPDRRRSS